MLAGLEPGALLLTGDLVDGKIALGRGHQLKTEWEVCSRSWETTHCEAQYSRTPSLLSESSDRARPC